MTPQTQRYPKLRALDARPTVQNGRSGVLLRDPLQLSGRTLVIPQPLHLVLPLCDGTREDAGALSASLAIRHGVRIPPGAVAQLLQALDQSFLLDNATAEEAQEQALAAYRQAPFRTPTGAGQSYPQDADQLKRLLEGHLDAVRPASTGSSVVRGLLSPHIDYARGGSVYARVWLQGAEATRAADLVVILGTDHYGPDGSLTLTRQHYATPYGLLPTARGVVDALANALGDEVAFAHELDHRTEHSIELALTWLHHLRHGQPCQIVPILCGSFQHLIQEDIDPEQDGRLTKFIDVLRHAVADPGTLVVSAGDLAHLGPAFGGHPLSLVGRAQMKAADDLLIERICAGDPAGFLTEIQRMNGRNNVCGVPPIYLTLRALEPIQGELVAYERCPADAQGTSFVSVCGIAFS
jgi:AmmeMemoRadiSam system protein B